MSEKETILIVDGFTGESIIRELTNVEIVERQVVASELAAVESEKNAKSTSRESALAKLAALGLTEEEIAAL